MISFNKEEYIKFLKSSVSGTAYLAYRDVPMLINMYASEIKKVLDLGCGSGRSTTFLKNFPFEVYCTDISEDAIELIKNTVTENAFLNVRENKVYPHFPYDAIFAFYTLLHLESEEEILNEYKKCFHSLRADGYLFIVSADENLFLKNYLSVECLNKELISDGAHKKIYLKNIDCEVNNCYWSYLTLIKLAKLSGFHPLSIHFPLGKSEDDQKYIDEYNFSPYYYIIFKKI